MNLALYGLGEGRSASGSRSIFGVAFAGEELPGIDLIMPDIAFLIAERRNYCGLVLTHAHEDHFGALLDPVAAAALPGLCDAVHRFAVYRQARGRAGRAGGARSTSCRSARVSRSGIRHRARFGVATRSRNRTR
jgi:hypothetical protein